MSAIYIIDHCTVSVAILDVGQSRQKLQQMCGKFLKTIDPYNSTITCQILTKNVSLKKGNDMEIISSKQEEEFKDTTIVANILKLHTNPKIFDSRVYMEF